MDIGEQRDLLNLLKAVADEHRLTMLNLMHGQERTVGEMADLFSLSEPTISHHVSKLHSAGLLRLRMAGTQRFYSLNQTRLERFKAYVGEIEVPPTQPEAVQSDNGWIEALDWNDEDKRVLIDYTVNGRLTQLPQREKKWLVVLRWLAGKFEPGMRYTEKQVNAILTDVHEDYATIRRNLVEYGFMRRERGGGNYWLTPADE
jgi:hypothetical protein